MPRAARVRPGRGNPDHYRETAAKRGYDYKWQQYRKLFLRRNPLCQEHLRSGRLVPATVVDHIIPHRGDEELFWRISNHEGLCVRCHTVKTAKGM